MNKKVVVIVTIFIILVVIICLWTSLIIPKNIAKLSATNYLKKNFPKKQYEFVDIEWSSSFGGYVIKYRDENDEIVSFLLNNKYFPITPAQGMYELENNYTIEFGGMSNIDDFYNHSITSQYKDIRMLEENYTTKQAQKDNCFVIGAMIHNDNLYSKFMDKYNKKEDAFIRVVQSTIEGDIFIIDILYEAKTNKVHIVKDDKRDKFSAKEERTIKYKVYEKIGVWNYKDFKYWVAYNEELPKSLESDNSDNLFIIATIN